MKVSTQLVPTKEAVVFAHHCTDCNRRMLVFPGQIVGLDHGAEGLVVTYTCWCGSTQRWSPAAAPEARVAA